MQRVFITGASSGIGLALAREYAARGAQLGLLGRRESVLTELMASLPNPERHHCYAIDVNDHAALQRSAEAFIEAAGGIDIVIASAGISHGTLSERPQDLAVFEQIMATNVLATVATFSAFIPRLKEQSQLGQGDMRLVGIASVAGIRGLPGAEAYSASKAAVISYCESLRVELRKYGIRVVTIAPGYIDTPMTQANNYPMPFLMPAEKFAQQALRVIAAGRSYSILPWPMRVVSWLLKLLPNVLYDALFARAPYKAALDSLPPKS
jgi:NAD(P)-dependent dehydrogenase (short-subunit alcohol dehydrogenase family)